MPVSKDEGLVQSTNTVDRIRKQTDTDKMCNGVDRNILGAGDDPHGTDPVPTPKAIS